MYDIMSGILSSHDLEGVSPTDKKIQGNHQDSSHRKRPIQQLKSAYFNQLLAPNVSGYDINKYLNCVCSALACKF